MLHVKVLLVGINSYFVKYSQRVEKMDADKINFHSPPFRFQEKKPFCEFHSYSTEPETSFERNYFWVHPLLWYVVVGDGGVGLEEEIV